MPAKYFSIIRNYVLSVSSQRKYNFYHQNTLVNAFRTSSRNIIGRKPSMVIPLLANQDLTPMLVLIRMQCKETKYSTIVKMLKLPGHVSHGLPQATPKVLQQTSFVTTPLALFSQTPLFRFVQHFPTRTSEKEQLHGI